FGIKDFDAAKAFVEDGLGGSKEERNGWLIYEEEDEVRALLRGDVMIVSPDFAFTDQLISGDYGKLSNSAHFQDTLARLPLPQYDVMVYAALGDILAAQAGANSTPPATRGTENDAAPDAHSALIDALGHVAIGGVNIG